MQAFKEYWDYIASCAKDMKQIWSMAAFLIGVFFMVASPLLKPLYGAAYVDNAQPIFRIIGGVLVVAWGALVLPIEKLQAQKKEYETRLAERCNDYELRLQALDRELATLRARLDERENHKRIREQLGLFLSNLEFQIGKIQKLDAEEYTKQTDKMSEVDELLIQIGAFLKDKVGAPEFAEFDSMLNYVTPHSDGAGSEEYLRWFHTIHQLQHKARQLTKIIERWSVPLYS